MQKTGTRRRAYWDQPRGMLGQRLRPVARRRGRRPSRDPRRCRPSRLVEPSDGGFVFLRWPAPAGPKTRGCPGLEERWSLRRSVCRGARPAPAFPHSSLAMETGFLLGLNLGASWRRSLGRGLSSADASHFLAPGAVCGGVSGLIQRRG